MAEPKRRVRGYVMVVLVVVPVSILGAVRALNPSAQPVPVFTPWAASRMSAVGVCLSIGDDSGNGAMSPSAAPSPTESVRLHTCSHGK